MSPNKRFILSIDDTSFPSSKMGKNNKKSPKISSPGSRENLIMSRNGVRPIDFDRDKYDNKELTLRCVFPGNTDLTMAFTPATIPANSFISGVNSDAMHAQVQKAILDAIIGTYGKAYTITPEVVEAFDIRCCFKSYNSKICLIKIIFGHNYK